MNTKLSMFVLGSMVIGALFAGLPSVSSASTFAYVNTSGNVSYVQANSPSGAFVNSTNIATHSGVMLVGNTSGTLNDTPVSNGTQLSGYLYVNTSGEVVRVDSDTSAEAFADSNNISTHSGVMLIDSVSDSNMVGDDVEGF